MRVWWGRMGWWSLECVEDVKKNSLLLSILSHTSSGRPVDRGYSSSYDTWNPSSSAPFRISDLGQPAPLWSASQQLLFIVLLPPFSSSSPLLRRAPFWRPPLWRPAALWGASSLQTALSERSSPECYVWFSTCLPSSSELPSSGSEGLGPDGGLLVGFQQFFSPLLMSVSFTFSCSSKWFTWFCCFVASLQLWLSTYCCSFSNSSIQIFLVK